MRVSGPLTPQAKLFVGTLNAAKGRPAREPALHCAAQRLQSATPKLVRLLTLDGDHLDLK